MKQIIIILSTLFLLIACGSESKSPVKEASSNEKPGAEFNEYWYQGKAELTGYKLEQARYGEIHTGTAVMVFVTEDFSKKKQVKLDYPQKAKDDAVKILKLNTLKKFNTGIYDYSVMTSSFTPINRKNHPNSLKITCSSQEWCGHTFTQLNLKENGYEASLFSYFESEGDEILNLPKVWTENEIWNMIRINPKALPQGELDMIPDLQFQRFKHVKLEAVKALISIVNEGENTIYSIEYPSYNRTLKINFTTKFPYQINGWEDSYKSGWGAGAKVLTTKATRMKSIMSPYWQQNSVADVELRKELGLE